MAGPMISMEALVEHLRQAMPSAVGIAVTVAFAPENGAGGEIRSAIACADDDVKRAVAQGAAATVEAILRDLGELDDEVGA